MSDDQTVGASAEADATTRRSKDETRDAIRRAAARLFPAQGFAATSVRDIAREAEADPALVIRYFGSKERLFLETMTVENTFEAMEDAPPGRLGVAVLQRILLSGPRARQVYTALIRAADRADVRSYLVQANEAQLVGPIARRIGGPGARFRASLIAAQVSGLLHSLWILEDPALTSVPIDDLIETYGAALQSLADAR